jgi:hypothetical protein
MISLLGFLFITLPMIRRGLKESGRDERGQAKRILAEGTSARAIVRSIQPTNAILGNEPIVMLGLDIRMPGGEVRSVTVRTAIYTVHIPKFQEGCEVDVKYREEPGGLAVAVDGAYLP